MKKICFNAALAIFIVFFLVGCTSKNINKVREQNNTFNVTNSGAVNTGIDLKVGTLNIKGSDNNSVTSKITYTRPEWKPIIKDTKNSYGEDINISQPNIRDIDKSKDDVNEWNLNFTKNVPINMMVKTRVGNVNADLRELQLNKLDIDMGTGKLQLDISGNYKKNLNVNLNCGVGTATIYFPKNIGVMVEVAKQSIAEKVNSTGFTNNGDTYTNSKYGKSNVTLYVKINTGVGKLNFSVN